jgi:cellulose synthase/poly-beta-1,6-N-acetylglucosamine synthase-like glycosyltransferase
MWADAMGAVLLIAALLLALPSAVLLSQVVMALRESSQGGGLLDGPRPSVAVLVPAHDEAGGIVATLASIRRQLRPGDRLLVVADNCSDDTAALARAAGAAVTERTDTERRGKGYALDHGMRELAARPPVVVVVIDADCDVGEGCIDQLARRCAATRRPVQAMDLMLAPPGAGAKLRYAEFAWRVKNLVRPLGGARLGWPCQLMGTGMALRWPDARGLVLAHAGLAEDIQMGIELALGGRPPLFEPAVRVTSRFPSSDTAAQGQRWRWEQGHLGSLLHGVPVLVRGAWRRRDPRLLGMALDLGVPPLALLLLLSAGLAALCVAWSLAGGGVAAALVAVSALLLQAAAISAAWWNFGRPLLRAGEIVGAPWYALRKLPLYLRMLVRRQRGWVRTERDER